MEKFKTTVGLSDKVLKERFPEYYYKMIDFVKEDGISLSERMWLYQNNLSEAPKCGNCEEKVAFIKFYKGYRKYCSRKCAVTDTHKNEEVSKSRISKMRECNFDSEKRKEMTRKSSETKSAFDESKNEEINKKREITNIEKWGVANISENSEIKRKISEKLKEVLPEAKRKKTLERISKTGFGVNLYTSETFSLSCPKCGGDFEISSSLFNQRNRFGIEICLSCNPNNNDSDFERKVSDFIKETYSGEVVDKCKKFKKYEIDIYLPELKLGFECNGLWWHSDRYKESDYHIKKMEFFSEMGIRIINIWEDDWKFKQDIVRGRIASLLKKNRTIYARKCEIRQIGTAEMSVFLTKNHIQGNVLSKIKIGLYFEEELVSAMSFGSFRKNLGREKSDNSYELLRFCNKHGVNVAGAASRLFGFFVKSNEVLEIISYASRDWSVGDLYERLGFSYVKKTGPNYFYFHKDIGMRINRYNFRKDKLVKDGYDKDISEREIMASRGYFRVYDTGSLLYSYRKAN